MSYLDKLSHELTRVGISGRLRRRIVFEIADHLECDPDAKLGDPRDIADEFADQLGTARARRAAFAAFAALAIAGIMCAVAFFAVGPAGPGLPRLHPRSAAVAAIAMLLVALASQVAFVSGLLAGLRAWRLRHDCVVSRAEAVVVGRRAGVALVSGFAAMAGLALIAVEYEHGLAGWLSTFALVGAAAGTCALAAATPAVVAAVRLRPATTGPASDMCEDLGPLAPASLRERPWEFAFMVAGGLALLLAVAGVLQDDPYDGALRGMLEGVACLAGFGVLGRYLGLR